MTRTFLLTGANGFIGTQIARELLSDDQSSIIALVRATDVASGVRRLARDWWEWPELVKELGARVEVVCGDVSEAKLGLDETTYETTRDRVTHIIHTAADWRFLPLAELRKTNVEGTANVVEFAKDVHGHHGLGRLSHISTAYVAGGRTGHVAEDQLTDAFGFATDYERSKYEGELLVKAAKEDLPVSIFRPSMVVGDSRTGAIKTFNTFYFPLRLYLTGRMRFLPVSKALRINVIPVDYVASAIARLTVDPRAEGLTFHLVAPYESLPTIKEVMELIRAWAQENLRVRLRRPVFARLSSSATTMLLRLRRAFSGEKRGESNALVSLAPYFSENRRFERDNVDRLLGRYDLEWKGLLPRLLEYSTYNSFFHRSDRTVHEQVMFRLGSTSRPITYYDLVDGKAVMKSSEEMLRDILTATSALKNSGIGPGDRVAMSGWNSTRYLAADIAIGLLGAVSVPLYYTAPPADMDQIIQASGAKLFFVGTPALVSRINEFRSSVPMVSICRGPVPQELRERISSFEEFLSRAADGPEQERAPVGFDDVATLMYSSGTTGRPKGAIFNHGKLRYMAESIVSLTPWEARNGRCTYLSFLPMSHVVEGILATYSPYYIPSPVDIYFLEDFKKLADALPQVKPTIFFSVPRIYERIWEALEKNSFGRMYARREKGLLKRAMRGVVRRSTLRKAGLDGCAQLMAGSARFDEGLLLKYRELGIEIHNAYGLTEAPLITMNRIGRNRIGTVGEPLPMTEVKTAPDDEIMVRGPQVTVGYYDKSLEPPVKDGWLMTGDLGRVTEEGSLVLFGRKKELLKTSYGKCIYCGKIEDMLKAIEGVDEAMLVAESRPYCSAVLWVHKDRWNEATLRAIDLAVVEMNRRLSNPEKVKKWALMVNLLSVENGDLTPNLKLKRNLMMQRHAKVIEALYGGPESPGEVHFGAAEKEA